MQARWGGDTIGAMELVELKCRNCGATLGAESISTQLSVARCGHCDCVFALAVPQPAAAAPARPLREVSLPDRIDLEQTPEGLRMHVHWARGGALILLGFGIFWLVLNLTLFRQFDDDFGPPLIVRLIFPAVGVGMIYAGLAGLVNTSEIVIGNREIRVSHGPLPIKMGKRLAVDDIDQIYCRQHTRHSENSTTVTYAVHVATRRSGRVKLIDGLNDVNHALYIEQEIERRLGIADSPVGEPDEIPR